MPEPNPSADGAPPREDHPGNQGPPADPQETDRAPDPQQTIPPPDAAAETPQATPDDSAKSDAAGQGEPRDQAPGKDRPKSKG